MEKLEKLETLNARGSELTRSISHDAIDTLSAIAEGRGGADSAEGVARVLWKFFNDLQSKLEIYKREEARLSR